MISRIRHCSLILLFLGLCGCAGMNTGMPRSPQNSERFYKLFQLNDMNERAFGYFDYCLKGREEMNGKFLQNMEITSNMLFDEVMETQGWQPEYAVDQIVKRREVIQDKLYYHYKVKGCLSEEAESAGQHYRMLSGTDATDIKAYFDN